MKVNFRPLELSQLTQTAEVFGAQVLAVGKQSITFEIAAEEERVDGFIKALNSFGICGLAQRAGGVERGR